MIRVAVLPSQVEPVGQAVQTLFSKNSVSLQLETLTDLLDWESLFYHRVEPVGQAVQTLSFKNWLLDSFLFFFRGACTCDVSVSSSLQEERKKKT